MDFSIWTTKEIVTMTIATASFLAASCSIVFSFLSLYRVTRTQHYHAVSVLKKYLLLKYQGKENELIIFQEFLNKLHVFRNQISSVVKCPESYDKEILIMQLEFFIDQLRDIFYENRKYFQIYKKDESYEIIRNCIELTNAINNSFNSETEETLLDIEEVSKIDKVLTDEENRFNEVIQKSISKFIKDLETFQIIKISTES